jgi:hypothetical protein
MKIEIEVSTDNEGTDSPWWAIVDPRQNFRVDDQAVHAVAGMITGPFFSRESAQAHLDSARNHFGKNPQVYCLSGCYSPEYWSACKNGEKMVDTIKHLTGRAFSHLDIETRVEMWLELTPCERNEVRHSCRIQEELKAIFEVYRELSLKRMDSFRFSKLPLYGYLKKLKVLCGISVTIKTASVDGWFIQIEDCTDITSEIRSVCEKSKVMDSHYYPNHSGKGFLITITRCGMDQFLQEIFDRASNGEWLL